MNEYKVDLAKLSATVQDRMRKKRINGRALAELLDVSSQAISQWRQGKGQPTEENLEALANVLDFDPESVLETSSRVSQQNAITTKSNAVQVPILGFGSAGGGYSNGEYPEQDTLIVDATETYRTTGHSAHLLKAMTIVGDSLAPEIAPNTRILYIPTTQYLGDGLYVLSIDGNEIVKRIQVLPGGALEIIPFNPDYHTELLLPVKDKDNPDYGSLYRSQRTNLPTIVRCVGKVVQYTKPA